jgi:hypothetical protein
MFRNSLSEYSFYDLDNNGNDQTENDHGSNRKIKSKVFPFNPDVAWQPADPI